MKNISRSQWPFVLVFVGAASFILGSCFEKGSTAEKGPYRELEKFSKVLNYVESNYVEPVKSEELIEGAIKGMLDTLDPHSAYLPPEIYREMKVETSGKFGGLGIEVSVQDGYITVVTPIDDTPAFKAGIKAGDRITKIAGKATKSISLPEAVTLMRGKVGSKISLTVVRKGLDKPLDFNLARESIKIQSIRSHQLENGIGYFRISSFQERTSEDLQKAIEKMGAKKLSGVVLDLRGNPGGLLDQAVRVVNLFVDEGPIVYTIGRDRSKKEVENAQRGRRVTDAPLVVLVDGSSASASEIVAGALQDYGRGIIAGQQTFGKGSVQTIIPVGDEAGLKVTIARYYTPSGRSIQVRGIKPDVLVDVVDPKTVEAARKSGRRLREGDLERHFDNEDDTPAMKELHETDKPEEGDKAGKVAVQLPLSFEERIKQDYMVIQAQGILKTMAVVKGGIKKPDFKLEEEAKKLSDKEI